MDLTATGHIRTWMQPLIDARVHGQNRLFTVMQVNLIALVYYRQWTLPLQNITDIDFTADGRDRCRNIQHMDFISGGHYMTLKYFS